MSRLERDYVQAALKKLMEPTIKLLLRNSVTYREFILFCKSVYVDIAAKDFGVDGRPTNVSRIALLTGIDRKEVKRVQDEMLDNNLVQSANESFDRLTRLLNAWHSEPAYVNDDGSPKLIPLEGEAPSFADLAKRFSGDVTGNTLLKELLNSKAIEKNGDKRLRALKRYYVPNSSDPAALLRAGSVINELSSTLFHNLYTVNDKARAKPRFERRATNNNMSAKKAKAFKAFIDDEGQQFLERVDDWLTDNEEPADSKEKRIRLGTGLFAIECKTTEEDL